MINFKNEIAKAISKASEIDANELYGYLEVPPNKEMGDYAFPCFKLAKVLKKAPPVIATKIKEKIECNEYIKDVQIVKLLRNILILVKSILNKDYYSKQFKKAFVTTARSFLYNYDDDTIYNICTN